MDMNQNKTPAPCLSFLGTGSDVGKSVLATAMCRVLADRGISTAPFKAQNMSNNSGVTPEGLEMGRAQIVQAEACRLAPHVDMNPVLLKPTGETGSQVVVLGRAVGNQQAREYYGARNDLFPVAASALDRLRAGYEAVIMEGAGSCAEVNLMARDFVNLRIAAHAAAPAVLVADIHKGGVFAQIVGTLACLSKKQQDQIAGFMINRFRGDVRLFDDGVRWLTRKTGKPCFGVIPWFDHIRIEAEDSVAVEQPERFAADRADGPAVAVIRLPHISNFTDFDPLDAAEGLSVCFLEQPRDLSRFSAVILPGSKNTRADMAWLERTGWADRIRSYAQAGGHVLGICGGYQMLGQKVRDPDGLEGDPGETTGLGLLPAETRLSAPKTTTLARFVWDGIEAAGYEIHMGRTLLAGGRKWLTVTEQNGRAVCFADGCQSEDGRVLGTYMHGLFDEPRVLARWLAGIGLPDPQVPRVRGYAYRDAQYAALARHFEQHADVDALINAMGISPGGGAA
ncbi:MAG: cobyric acid synthase [Desulfobacterales bacterium]